MLRRGGIRYFCAHQRPISHVTVTGTSKCTPRGPQSTRVSLILMTLLQTPVAPSDHTHLRHCSCHPTMRLLQVAGFYEGAFLSDVEFWITLIRLFICHSLLAWCYLLSMPTDWHKLSLLPTNMFLLNLWIILSLSTSWTGVKVCLTLTVVLQIPHWTNLHLLSSL